MSSRINSLLAVIGVLGLVVPQTPRVKLDEAQALSADLKYAAAVSTFEAVQAQQPDAVTSLDGLKMVTVYAETGNTAKFLELTRWMVQRWRTPKTVTDAERQIKGYVVHRSARDPQLIAHAVEVTRYASEQAVAQDAGDYQGFFDTTRGVALYRAGRYADAAAWLAKWINHENLWVRSLAQPFYAMTLRAQGQTDRAAAMLAQARRTAAAMPAAGTPEYRVQWTDTLITKMAMQEAEDVFARRVP